MATAPTYFADFLSVIRLSDNQVSDLKKGHSTLRKRLLADEDLAPIIVSTFLQGSYRRSTAVKPKNGNKSDVDIIVVTNLDSEYTTPEEALNKFIPFLEKHYEGKYRKQGRSLGISLSYVDLDIVPTSAPSEAVQKELGSDKLISESTIEESIEFFSESEESSWKDEPLLIPDREVDSWDKTHPLEQIRWTVEKNKRCNGHYINVVKALKWWKKVMCPNMKHPKSYPLEHFIGDCCPDNIESVAEGVVLTLEKIANDYPTKPFLADRGVPQHDVFGRLSDDDYNDFFESICDAAKKARDAFDCKDLHESVAKWRDLFGSMFPEPPTKENNSVNGFSKRTEKTKEIPRGRFA